MTKKLYRSRNDRILGGVCAGIGEYLNADPTLIRLLWILFTLLGGSGIIVYIIAWIIIPEQTMKIP
ncbi:phage shock protein C, PspC [Methanosalsum zhilinae DSM 4017]|uniref:Phage shock protein C, PspC n=1 Tax=Methanosalsum zhilinae (strain DSM 4017 / NBRC 107636 / OCM 62 / WeN5) TaxID=679901 RepID=F7XQ51_METZD|nr:PspC domain-containing protein [Methanosalsum zhilinae]AEH60412.1 phage shock protein C, PspC [Methanosalsum zhilinae DSM 4017]